METTQEHPLATVNLDIDASLDQVWEALTSADGWASWMGDGSTIGDGVGEAIFAVDPVTGEPKQGEIEEFEHGTRLGYRWWSEQDPTHASHVSITLTPNESGTRVTVVETAPAGALTARASAQAATGGWAWRVALLSLSATAAAVLSVRS